MKQNKELNKIQKKVDYEIVKVIKNSSDEEKGIVAKHVSLDVNVLYSECDNLYEVNDTKQDLSKKLLEFVRDNRHEFKHFSKIAEDIINKERY